MNTFSEWYQIVHNLVDYPLRRFFHWRRSGLTLRNESKKDLYAHLDQPQRGETLSLAARYRDAYRLDSLYRHSTANGFRENLFYIQMMETALNRTDVRLPDPLSAADIGPSNWFYVQGLAAFLRWYRTPEERELHLTAFEPDAYQVQVDLYSRYDHALASMDGLSGVSYLPNAFRLQPQAYRLITLFFPFVFIRDHLEWGLPKGMFDPLTLLDAVWRSLEPGGLLIIANQGLEEHRRERENLESLKIPVTDAFKMDSLLYTYPEERYLLVSRHET
jgi:hypothetical protein